MPSLYNEIEPFAAEWMRNLAQAGHIATGTVDERSIRDLRPVDVSGAVQFHAFAGLGAWSYALRLAGWPDDQPVWTGSCPCQPFSGAGRKGGFDDERHLWPTWFGLIRECRPAIVFGEQVASPDGLAWLDLVSADLEGEGYAFGASDLCAAGVGAPHIRQRLYFVAIADPQRRDGQHALLRSASRGGGPGTLPEATGRGVAGELGDARREGGGRYARAISGAEGEGAGERVAARDLADESCAAGAARTLGNAERERREWRQRNTQGGEHDRQTTRRKESDDGPVTDGQAGPWSHADWLPCRDGKARPVEPGTFPLAHGAPSRVGRLRAYGNAIVPEVAATFIRAVMSASSSRGTEGEKR